MKNRSCPARECCLDYLCDACQTCATGNKIVKLNKKIARLEKKTKALQAKIAQHTDVEDDEFGLMMNCAVRYSLGRQTYMPSVVIGYITPLLPKLTTRTLWTFKRDVEEAESYGHETIDKPGWMKFLVAVIAELNRRAKEDNDGR